MPLLLRSAKSRPDHPNHGRPYWACANDDEWSCCGLFVWADLPLESQGDARDLVSSVCCRVHGLPTLRRRITRHTANHGRIFLVCSARQRCDFFQWADKPRFKFTRWRPPSLRTPYVRAPPIEPPRSAAAPGTTSAQVSGLDLLRAEREIHRLRLAGALTPDNASGLLATLDSPDALLTAAVVSVLNANADEAAVDSAEDDDADAEDAPADDRGLAAYGLDSANDVALLTSLMTAVGYLASIEA